MLNDKTCDLTESYARNDPINFRIYVYSFRDFEDEDGIQDVISPYSLDQILISNTPQTRKRVKKLKKSKDFHIVVSRKFDLLKNPRMILRREEYSNLYKKLGVTVECVGSSRSTAEIMRHLVN